MNKFNKYHVGKCFDYMSFTADIHTIYEVNKDIARSLLVDLFHDETYKVSKKRRLDISRWLIKEKSNVTVKVRKGELPMAQFILMNDIFRDMHRFLVFGNLKLYPYLKDELLPEAEQQGIDVSKYKTLLLEYESESNSYWLQNVISWLQNFDNYCGMKRKLGDENRENLVKSLKSFRYFGGSEDIILDYRAKYGLTEDI